MLSKAIEALEDDIASLKDRTAREIKDIDAYLSQTRAKIKLRPRIIQHKGYSAFSINWQRLVFYNFSTRRPVLKAIRKGRGHLVPKSRLLSHCQNCDSWETEYIWEKEQEFARVRRKVAFLSRALTGLKQFCASKEAGDPEQCFRNPGPIPAVNFMGTDEVIKAVVEALNSFKKRTVRVVSEINVRLAEAGQATLRPRIGVMKKSGAFTVEWVKPNGCDPVTGEPSQREIPREGKYSMRRSRLLAHCRGCEECEQEFIWEREEGFARVRRQMELLTQAMTALKQYAKEAD
jgi:hypothetical protein